MVRPVIKFYKSQERNLGALLTIGRRNRFGWQTNTLTIYLLFFELALGLHFRVGA
jgi:hypothetical protein